MNRVEPIRDDKLINEIIHELSYETGWHWRRIFLLFTTMFYTGLRVSDVVKLRKENVMGTYIRIVEKKTQKENKVWIVENLKEIYADRLEDLEPGDYIFESRKRRPDGTKRPITTRDAAYDMALIKRRFNIQFPFACHSMRKTHGYYRYVKLHQPIELLRRHFNHSSEEVTRLYLGLDQQEADKAMRALSIQAFKVSGKKRKKQIEREESVALEVERQDRTERGRKYGLAKREEMRRAVEKKLEKSVADAQRYEREKAKRTREV